MSGYRERLAICLLYYYCHRNPYKNNSGRGAFSPLQLLFEVSSKRLNDYLIIHWDNLTDVNVFEDGTGLAQFNHPILFPQARKASQAAEATAVRWND
jgi:hypothetical protein